MSKEQTTEMFNWIYRGVVTLILIVLWAVVQNTYAEFRVAAKTVTELSVEFRIFKDDTKESIKEIRDDIKRLKK